MIRLSPWFVLVAGFAFALALAAVGVVFYGFVVSL